MGDVMTLIPDAEPSPYSKLQIKSIRLARGARAGMVRIDTFSLVVRFMSL